jgi:hypothetical protein
VPRWRRLRLPLEVLAAHLAVTCDRFRQGAAPELDVLRAEVELANHRASLVEVENRLQAVTRPPRVVILILIPQLVKIVFASQCVRRSAL